MCVAWGPGGRRVLGSRGKLILAFGRRRRRKRAKDACEMRKGVLSLLVPLIL